MTKPALVPLKKAAERLGLSADWLRRLVARHGIGHVRPGGPAGRIFFTEEQLAEYIRQHSKA